MGFARDGVEDPATFVEQNVQNFHRFRKKRVKKRAGCATLSQARVICHRGVGMILTRYREACRAFLKLCFHISLVCDASRVAGKDVMLVAVLGTDAHGKTKAMWCPPQVLVAVVV